jgi:SAM-dependent methyltransferase
MSELLCSSAQMRNAGNYNRWTFEQLRPFVKGRGLEVGCGVGTFTRLIAAHAGCAGLHAIDTSRAAIDYLKTQQLPPKVAAECVDLMEVSGTYDFVVCMNVLEHVADDQPFFGRLFERLGPDGVLFLLVPAHRWLATAFDAEAGHHRRYTRQTLNQYPLPAGVQRVEQYYFNMLGAVGYWIVYKLLRQPPAQDPAGAIGFFDRALVPLSQRLLPRRVPFGTSLISIYRKRPARIS